MGIRSSRPSSARAGIEDRRQEETISFEVSSLYQDDHEEDHPTNPCFFFSMTSKLQSTFLQDPIQSGEHTDTENNTESNTPALPLPVDTTEPMHFTEFSDKARACESIASTLSMESWSIKSLDGTISLTSSKRRKRKIDIYQTDATMILNEEGEDWSPLVFLSSQSRLQLPFRPCTRKRCYCKNNKSMNIPNRFIGNSHHSRETSDDLQGLWIPLQVDELDIDEVGERRWLPKAHSERNLHSSQRKQGSHVPVTDTQSESSVPEGTVVHGRARALSEDLALQQQPPVLPPSPGRRGMLKKSILSVESTDSNSSLAPITRAIPLTESTSLVTIEVKLTPQHKVNFAGKECSSDSKHAASSFSRKRSDSVADSSARAHATSASSSTKWQGTIVEGTIDEGKSKPLCHRLRSRSEDVVDMHPGKQLMCVTNNGIEQKCDPRQSLRRTPYHRQRSRSEDVVDQASNVHREAPGQLQVVVEPPVSDNASLFTKRSGSRSQEFRAIPTKQECDSSADSPTSVVSFPSNALLAENRYRSKLQDLRESLDNYRNTKQCMKVIAIYQTMAWLHFQNARFDAARCVINHALERLYVTQRCSHGYACLTLEETLGCVDESAKLILAQTLLSKAQILLASDKGGEILFCTEAKYLTEIAISLVQPRSRSSPEFLSVIAEGLFLLGRIHSHNGSINPVFALDNFERAQSIFRSLSCHPLGYIKYSNWAAQTAQQVGNLHLEQGLLELAKFSFWEALRLYRFLHQHDPDFLLVDMATTLTSLGWIHVLEKDLALAQQSTMEALCLLQRHHGQVELSQPSNVSMRSLRNLASVEFHLGMVAILAGQISHALGWLKAALRHQQAAFHAEHTDVAVTMEVIGSSYHHLGKSRKARMFLESALDIRKRSRYPSNPLDVARIQSRLALVLLQLNDVTRAESLLSKAMNRYQLCSTPLDEIGQIALQGLSIRR